MTAQSGAWKAGALPPFKLPLFYQGFATLCFALALVGTIVYAQDLTGFYYHPHVLALTHLITLGWISANILGSLYMVAPMALQTYLPARRSDGIAFILYCIGVSGMVAHFWRDRPVGMAWSAGCAYAAVAVIGVKVLIAIFRAKMPGFVRLHVCFAFVNFFIGGAWGVLVAFHKIYSFLPTSSSPNVIAHAHLAAIGWATMMVFGIGYRLLPMFLPAEPAKGRLPWLSAILLEGGILGFFVSTLFQSKLVWFFSALIAVGMLIFFGLAIRTAKRRKPSPPPEPPRPDFSILHAPFGFLSLAICVVWGFVLIALPPSEKTLQWALAYATLGLIGFLGQMITGLKPKILGIFTWYHAFSRNPTAAIPRPVDMPVRAFQIAIFGLWATGLPCLILGLANTSRFLISSGATLLLAALLLSTLHEFSIVRLIWKIK